MARIRSLAKELYQLELQRQAASPPSPPAASSDRAFDSTAPAITSSMKWETSSFTSSPRDDDILASAAHASPTAEREEARSSSPSFPSSNSGVAAELQSTSTSQLLQIPPPSSRDGAHNRSRHGLFALGGSRFDILMGGSHADGGACRKSQVRKATKACTSGGGKSGASTAEVTQQPQPCSAAEESSLLESGEGGAVVANPAPPLGTPCGIPTRPPFKRLLAQPFSHVLVCDFEATCASGSVHYPHEIIEFPVVVLDTATLRIVAEFHRYVRPLRNPKLTAFCTELTGITQEMVDLADPLPTVVAQFQDWLKTEVYPLCRMWARHYGPNHLSHNLKSEQRRFVYDELTDAAKANVSAEAMLCMATDGPWDMRRFMHECSVLRDGVAFPPVCYRYINIRHSYSHHFKCRQVRLTHMLKQMSMSFEGRRHSGIDDTRNIARVLAELFARGYRVHHVSTIKYAHRGDSFLVSNQAAQELLSEYGEMDETHVSKRTNARRGVGRQQGRRRV
ncbi:Exonuclease, putative [Leishmania lindenbergi]|uniref:Exonuclease n=1 Tax=Leishmania lindenbergi TaxID=651832 RepID=A0AAW3A3V0_9TRYP